MPRTLRNLIKASGHAGVAGQSFRNHVTGAASGARMSDYNLSLASWSGTPTNPLPVYADNAFLTITANFTRGSRAYHIQRDFVGAWAVSVTASGEGEGGAIETFSTTGSAHQLGVRVRGCYSGSPTVSVSGTQRNEETPPDPFLGPWPVYFQSITGVSPPTGNTELTLQLIYTPDLGPYNDAISGSWPLRVANRAVEMDTEWHSNASYTSLVTTAANFVLTSSAVYPTNPAGLLPGESITLYLRYKTKGTATWTNHGAVTCTDGR